MTTSVHTTRRRGKVIITGKVKNEIVAEESIDLLAHPPKVEGFCTASVDPRVHRVARKVREKKEKILESVREHNDANT